MDIFKKLSFNSLCAKINIILLFVLVLFIACSKDSGNSAKDTPGQNGARWGEARWGQSYWNE